MPDSDLNLEWREGNTITLLHNGGQFFPALCQAIDAARRYVHLETYIFNLDDAGTCVLGALERACRRGVKVRVVIDGVGRTCTLCVHDWQPWVHVTVFTGPSLRAWPVRDSIFADYGVCIVKRWLLTVAWRLWAVSIFLMTTSTCRIRGRMHAHALTLPCVFKGPWWLMCRERSAPCGCVWPGVGATTGRRMAFTPRS
jgi:hypothetical protein